MYELKKNGKVFTSKYVGTGPLSYEKRIYRVAVSLSLRNTGLDYSEGSWSLRINGLEKKLGVRTGFLS